MIWLPSPSEEEKWGTEHPGYETLGGFEPRDAKRIIKRLDEEHIPFEVDAPGEVSPRPTWFLRRHYLFIYVRPEHKQKAEAIVLEDHKLSSSNQSLKPMPPAIYSTFCHNVITRPVLCTRFRRHGLAPSR